MFYLKDRKKEKTAIVLRYYSKYLKGYFNYSVGMSIDSVNWDINTYRPKRKRGGANANLKPIELRLNQLQSLFEGYLIATEGATNVFDPIDAKLHLDKHFKNIEVQIANELLFSVFISAFIKEAPSKINRNTKKTFSNHILIKYRLLSKKIIEFEKSTNTNLKLSEITQKVYDDMFQFWSEEKNYSINYIGSLIKDLKSVLRIAEKEYSHSVNSIYKDRDFAVVKEESISIALSEKEIEGIYNLDLSHDSYLEKYRDWVLIGVWTGLRVSDLKQIRIDISQKFIEVQPEKTKEKNIKVVIPIHHHIKEVVSKRGTPGKLDHVEFNSAMKIICELAGINQEIKGSVSDSDTRLKVSGIYPKYKLVSSHTCRRSFATNMYLMNFPTLSIMKITGHTTEQSFLKYIKVTPKEHAEKLLAHWEEYYANKK